MTSLMLLLMFAAALFDHAEPEHVAACTVRRNVWMAKGEAVWWMQSGRFLEVTEWARREYCVWPCWEIEWRRSHFPLEEQIQGTFNDLREREARALWKNFRELERAGLLP